jgi:hypothetical protein
MRSIGIMENGRTEEGDKSGPLEGDKLGRDELDRNTLLSILSEILKQQHKQALRGRIRDEKRFKLRLDAVRVYAYVASVYGSILKDKDLSEIIKRLEVLESNANQS